MTTDKDALTLLAERCEAATVPSRELDALIEVELKRASWPDARVYKLGKTVGAGAGPKGSYRKASILFQYHYYTRSLDAAMTLVPEGDGICLNMGEGPWVGHFARIWNVSAELAVEGKDACEWEVHGVNPRSLALALCAAALRARTQTTKGDV